MRNSRTTARLAWLAAATSAGLILSACGNGGSQNAGTSGATDAPPTPVKVIVQAANFQDIVPYVAHSLGIDKKNGIDLNFIVSTEPLTPLLSNSADISLITGALAVTGRTQGYDVRVAGVLNGGQLVTLLVRNGLDIPKHSFPATFQALAGKTVATTVVGGGLDNQMRYAMKLAGIDPKSGFKDLAVGTSAAEEAAIKANRVDAMLAVEPQATQMVNAGEAQAVFDFLTDQAPAGLQAPSNVVVVSPNMVKSHNDVVRRFMTTLQQTAQYVSDPANTDNVVKIAKDTVLKGTTADETVLRTVVGELPPLLKSQCYTKEQFDAANASIVALGQSGNSSVTFEQLQDKDGALPSCG